MYAKIKSHPSAATLYGEKLVREGVVTREELERVWAGKKAEMQSEKEGDGTPFVAIARRAPVEPAPVDASVRPSSSPGVNVSWMVLSAGKSVPA